MLRGGGSRWVGCILLGAAFRGGGGLNLEHPCWGFDGVFGPPRRTLSRKAKPIYLADLRVTGVTRTRPARRKVRAVSFCPCCGERGDVRHGGGEGLKHNTTVGRPTYNNAEKKRERRAHHFFSQTVVVAYGPSVSRGMYVCTQNLVHRIRLSICRSPGVRYLRDNYDKAIRCWFYPRLHHTPQIVSDSGRCCFQEYYFVEYGLLGQFRRRTDTSVV